MTRLYIINGLKRSFSFDIKSAVTFVGRAPDNEIQIENNSVSRKHMKILRKDDKFFIEDLKSQNGTLVNGQAIEPGHRYEVKEGIPIAAGNVLISLGKRFSDNSMAVQYSIDLSDETSNIRQSLLYKDRRITKRKDLETIHEISTILMQSLDINEICEKIMDSLFSLFHNTDALLGKMANRVAHELRNPLTVVGGLSRRLYEKMPDDDPYKKDLKIILGEAKVLENKVSEIINIENMG